MAVTAPPPEKDLSAGPRPAGAAARRPLDLRGLWEVLRFFLPLGRSEVDTGRPLAVAWVVPVGLLTGLAWAGCFKLAWRVYGETANLRLIPALVVVLLECLLTGPFLALGLSRTVHLLAGVRPTRGGTDPAAPLSPVGTLILGLTLLSEWVLIASIPVVSGWWPSTGDWRHHFNFLYPAPLYRPLVLAPLWGRWAILLAATIGRTARQADPTTVALCDAMRPRRVLLHCLLPFALTSVFFSRGGNLLIGVVLGLLVFGVTYLVGVGMARRGGGQTRQSLYAAGQIAQLAFLALYRAFWPAIHG
jgi:hypothetical protein